VSSALLTIPAFITVIIAISAIASASEAATYTRIYSFCAQANCPDGSSPNTTVTLDSDGNIYGVTPSGGGESGAGTAFALIKKRTGYIYRKVHSFCSQSNCTDGWEPSGQLIVDVNGSLYGVTQRGGKHDGGVVYQLIPNGQKTKWKSKVLYDFCRKANCVDGGQPYFALTYQGAGSGDRYDGTSPLYGTARGGKYGDGSAYRLSYVDGRTKRREDIIYDFCSQQNCVDGAFGNGLIADAGGNLFGSTVSGGPNYGAGVVFELTPKANGKFKEKVLYAFCGQTDCLDGDEPLSPLLFGADGSLNGTMVFGGANTYGGVFSVLPTTSQEKVLYNFCSLANCADGDNPGNSGVAIDSNGAMFGTTAAGGANNDGIVYSLKNGSLRVLKNFCEESNCTDGGVPSDGVVLDSSGNAFGTTQRGGDNGAGVVFEVKP
jgi:uncharacterized repeat protein (TIGR03803 family)